MKKSLWLSTLALAAAMTLGCDNSSSTPATGGGSTTNVPGGGTAEAAKNAVAEGAAKAQDTSAAAVDTAKQAGAAVADAAAELLKDPKASFDKLQGLIDAKKFVDAEALLNQLMALKDKLPAEWASKLDGLKSAIETGKKAMQALPGGH